MAILSKILLVLAIILILPTGLVLASQNAVPGEGMYPVKRTLESGIIGIASLNPITSTYFKVDFSKRRFKETMVLLKKGGNTSQSLSDLVSQTKIAADSVGDISDTERRKQFAKDLLRQIEEYDKNLSKYGETKKTVKTKQNIVPTPTISMSPAIAAAAKRQATPTPVPTQPVGSSGNVVETVDNNQSDDVQKAIDQINDLKQELLKQSQQEHYTPVDTAASQQSSVTNVALAPTPTNPPAGGPAPTVINGGRSAMMAAPIATPTTAPSVDTVTLITPTPTKAPGYGIAEIPEPTISPTDTSLPSGTFSSASCTAFTVVAADPDAPSLPVMVDFWLRTSDSGNSDLPYDIYLGQTTTGSFFIANMATTINDGAHVYNPKTYLLAGKARSVWAAAINIDSTGARGTLLPPNHTGLGILTVTCSSEGGVRTLNE